MDAEYLKANVGTALSLGLVEVMHSQPADPVEFLSQFLFRHATSQRAQQQADSHARLLERADAVLEQREAERLKAEQDEQEKRQAEEKMAQSREEMFEQRLGQTGSVEEVWRAAVERVSECVGEMDSAVYVAELLGDEAQRLAYFMTSPGQEFMLENALEREQGPVTFDKLFPEDEEEEEEEEEEDEDEDEEEDEDSDDEEAAARRAKEREEKKKNKPLKPLKTVTLDNVMFGGLSDSVHFFQLPDAGAYHAVRVQYKSVLTEEALQAGVERLQEMAEEDEAAAQAAKEEAEAGGDEEEEDDDDDDDEDGEDEDEEAKEAKRKAKEEAKAKAEEEKRAAEAAKPQLTEEEKAAVKAEEDLKRLLKGLPRKTVRAALCLDTLGHNRPFTAEQLRAVETTVRKLQEALEGVEARIFRDELARFQALQAENGQAPGEEEEEEAKAKLTEEMGGDAAVEEDVQFALAKQHVLAHAKAIERFGESVVFVGGPLAVWQALLYLLGRDASAAVDNHNEVSWRRIRPQLNAALVEELKKYDPTADLEAKAAPHATLDKLSELVEELDDPRESNYPLACVLEFVKAAVAARRAAIERKEAEEQRLKDAENAAAAGDDDDDDDEDED